MGVINRKSSRYSLNHWSRIHLVAGEVIEGHNRAEVDLLSPRIKVVAHAIPVAQLLAVGRSMGFRIKTSRLFVQEEDVAVRRATGRWCRADVVGDEGSSSVKGAGLSDLHTRLDPMQDGSENIKGWEGSINVEAHDEICLARVEASEGKLRRRLGVCRMVVRW